MFSIWTLIGAVTVVAIALVATVLVGGLSQSPQAWVVRGLALALGATILSLAVLAPPVVSELADLAFPGTPGKLGTMDAETAVRLSLVVLGISILAVPGTWMDVGLAVLVTLTAAATVGDYRDRKALLACGDKPEEVQTLKAKPHKRDCPQATPAPTPPAAPAVRVRVPKSLAVAPVFALPRGHKAALVAVVQERDTDGLISTVARRYTVTPADDVPADKLTKDVAIDFDTTNAAAYRRFLADLTAAKVVRLLPSSRHPSPGSPSGDPAQPGPAKLSGVRLVLDTDVLFRFGSAGLTPAARTRLRGAARGIAAAGPERLFVAGHTDARGGKQHNRRLSQRRADAVARVLKRALRESHPAITAQGFGESQPLACNRRPDGSDDWTARAYNRRVEIWTGRPAKYPPLHCPSG